MEVQMNTKGTQGASQTRQKMSKEERAEKRRNDHIAREKDRERKRAKRKNVAYRQIEQERDRERKKMLRSDTAFRTLEKIRDRMRKERKKFGLELDSSGNFTTVGGERLVQPEVIISKDDVSAVVETLLEPEVILSSGEVPVDEKLLEPEVILSTNEYTHSQNSSYNQLPQEYNSNFTYENPPQNQF